MFRVSRDASDVGVPDSNWPELPRARHAAEAARLRYAIERVDYGNRIALARELLAQLHRGWHQPGRHVGTPTLAADLARCVVRAARRSRRNVYLICD